MFFFSEPIEGILRKQKLWSYIEKAVLSSRDGKDKPGPHLVQVVTNNSISDGVYDYPCNFTCESFRKGSYLRMTKWEVDMTQQQVVIHQAQYLGGAGCQVKHGKQWDLDKLKCIYKSNIYSKNFVIYFQPNEVIQQPKAGFEKLSFNVLKKRLRKDVEKGFEQFGENEQIFQKRKVKISQKLQIEEQNDKND